jgi:cytochrome c-type biogenesis protein CcmH/NrfG
MKLPCGEFDWQSWQTHAAECPRCRQASALIQSREAAGRGGIGVERRAAVFAAAQLRSSRPVLAPALAALAALVLAAASFCLYSELRTPEAPLAPVVQAEEPPPAMPELPQDRFAAAFDARAAALRDRVQTNLSSRVRSPHSERLRDRIQRLRAALAIDS